MPDDDLAAELRALAAHLDVPAPADQRAAVRSRLTRRPVRRWIIAGVAALVAVVGAVAPARAAVVEAVGDLLQLTGISVRREPAGPGARPLRPSPLPSVHAVPLEQARRAAPFPIRVPSALGPPTAVELADSSRVVTMTFRSGTVRFDQFDGAASPAFFKTARDAEYTPIGADPGIWVPGPHTVTYITRDGVEHTATARLAGPTLIWESGGYTYRLEGIATMAEARDIAVSLG